MGTSRLRARTDGWREGCSTDGGVTQEAARVPGTLCGLAGWRGRQADRQLHHHHHASAAPTAPPPPSSLNTFGLHSVQLIQVEFLFWLLYIGKQI